MVEPRTVAGTDTAASVLEHDTDGSGAAVLAALARLAAAVAAELVAGGLTIVGITGSSGKTSTKDLVAAVLAPLGEVVAPPGSFNNELGHPWTVLRADRGHRLPDPGDVGAPPRQHRRAGGDRAAVDRGRAQRRHRPSRRVRLPRGHRARPKPNCRKLFRRPVWSILNVDDDAVAAMAGQTAARVVRVSRSPGADVWAGTGHARRAGPAALHAARGSGVETEIQLAVHGDHQVSNALCAAAVALECGATRRAGGGRAGRRGPGVAAPHAGQHPRRRRHRHQRRLQRQPGFHAGRPEGAGLDGPPGQHETRRSWAVLGEMAELGDDAISEHDRIGRLAVRLDISRLVVVGTGRSMSAMHHGAVMEGSWGVRGHHGRRRRRRAGIVAGRTASRATWCWSRRRTRRGWATLAEALSRRTSMRQILIAVGIALTVSILLTPVLIRLFTRQGFGHEIREDGPPSHHKKRGTPSMGGVAILAGHLGRLPRHPPGRAGARRQRPVGVGPAGARAGDRARRRRLRRRPDQDPPLAQPRPEQDRQDRRPAASPRCCSACSRCSSATPTG